VANPWQPPQCRWPSASAQHWLDKQATEPDKLVDELKRRVKCDGVLARENKEI
jgi:hypothetical protein